MKFSRSLSEYVSKAIEDHASIPDSRKVELERISESVNNLKRSNKGCIEAVFICTHNSRRSHFAHIWSQVAATYFGKNYIQSFSGGTEQSEFNKNAIDALRRSGFSIPERKGVNPVYEVIYSDTGDSIECFSKHYSHSANPQNDFIAIMVCSDADQNCPIIPEAKLRFSLPFEDPKKADATDKEKDAYDKTCFEIATQMFYLMSKLN